MTHGTRLRLGALMTVLAVLVAACGDGETTTPPASDGDGTDDGSTDDGSTDDGDGEAGDGDAEGGFTIGVSNTLVGNGWREQMICAAKAESLSSGVVDNVVVVNRNGGPTEQIADLESLISQGVDAIVLNPTDREALNSVLEAAIDQGIVVVAVDQAVTADGAYVVTNDQVAYGRLGAEWLFEAMGGSGNVVEMRGIDGVPADTDRHQGFMEALENYPDIEVVAETFTGWDPSTGAQQALDLLSSRDDIGGIWTSGIDYTVVEQFQAANADFVPIVGADNNGFIQQLLEVDGLTGAAVTNPPAIGGVGVAIAIQVLQGQQVDNETLLTPAVFDNLSGTDDLESLYMPDMQPGWSSYVEIEPYTTYSADMVADCRGPGE
jgi:ribose transport system substrate-binding protein